MKSVYRWIDLVRPISRYGWGRHDGSPDIETAFEAWRWLRVNVSDAALEYASVWSEHRWRIGDDFADRLHAIFQEVLLRKHSPADAKALRRKGVALNKPLPIRSFVTPDDDVERAIRDLLRMKGQRTVHCWNACHPDARWIDGVHVHATEDNRWRLRVEYGVDGSSWARDFDSSPGVRLRSFLRRMTVEHVLKAPNEHPSDYWRWLKCSRTPNQLATLWGVWGVPVHVGLYGSDDGQELRCGNCGGSTPCRVPRAVDEIAADVERFSREHAFCRAPEAA